MMILGFGYLVIYLKKKEENKHHERKYKFIFLILLTLLFILLGFANGFSGPPSMALVGDIAKSEDNATGVGFFNLLGNIGIILGPIVGGFLLTSTDIISVFVIAGLFELISLIIILTLFLTVFRRKS